MKRAKTKKKRFVIYVALVSLMRLAFTALKIAHHPNKVVAHDMLLTTHSSVWHSKYLEVFAQDLLKIFKYLTRISYYSWLSTDMARVNSQTAVLIFLCLWMWIWKLNRKCDCVKTLTMIHISSKIVVSLWFLLCTKNVYNCQQKHRLTICVNGKYFTHVISIL